jgi:hypothetical protein
MPRSASPGTLPEIDGTSDCLPVTISGEEEAASLSRWL